MSINITITEVRHLGWTLLKTKNKPKTAKNLKLNKLQSHIRRPQVKKFSKQTMVRIEKYKQ